MKAGFAKIEITPPLGSNLNGYYKERYSTHIIAPLYASCLAFSDGETTAAAISLDISEIIMRDTDDIRRRVSEKCGLPTDAIFVHSIHTHTAPVISEIRSFFKRDASYYEQFCAKICDSVTLALADMKEATASMARGKAEGISFVRRFRMKDGTVSTNPMMKDVPLIDHAIGTPDETVQLIKLKREGASDIAVVNFGTHPDTIGGTGICPDWPGFMRDTVEAALADEADGRGVRVIFFNGAQGDVNHFDKIGRMCRSGVDHSRHMGRVLAGAVLSVYTFTEEIDSSKVFAIQKMAPVRFSKGTEEQVKDAWALNERYLNNDLPEGFVFTDIVMARRYIRTELVPENSELNVTCVGFGDVAFVGLPGEPFTEIGRQIKARSPFKMTVPCCNTNGSEGYFVTDDALAEAGYESSSSLFLPGVAGSMIETSLSALGEVANKTK